MFEAAELGHAVDKETYQREEPALRQALLSAQYELKAQANFSVIVLIAGLDGAGKSETVHQLNEWMDPRLNETRAFDEPTAVERERPRLWRFWRVLPPKGRIGLLFGGWYDEPLDARYGRQIDQAELDALVAENVRLENLLVHEGALVLKFWFHLSKADQKKRFKKLEKNPLTRWRVSDAERDHLAHYKRNRRVAERVLQDSNSGEAPWLIVEGNDERYRNLTVGRALLQALRSRLDRKPEPRIVETPALPTPVDRLEVLDRLDLGLRLAEHKYERELLEWQGRLNLALREARFHKHHSVVAVFEGNDAAGKGGAIRRVTSALDPRQYGIMSVAAPTEEERAQPYLWRFWRRLPRRGELTIFDRSWYGRVLVERVEGLIAAPDWQRAYGEITDFEAQLSAHGVIVVKFWLSISKDEQLRRFREREAVPWKNFKITPEDYRNREKWDAYAAAVNDMVERTSTEHAPWTLVEAEDKRYARVKVLRALATAVERAR
ncbi:MAG: UDP-galactose-lipid carrier transferase [Myxococcaceae bacterium]|nr:UDP-galactose-lipid carrier transferase [Myxococcaceae bacterium]